MDDWHVQAIGVHRQHVINQVLIIIINYYHKSHFNKSPLFLVQILQVMREYARLVFQNGFTLVGSDHSRPN